MKTIRAKVGRFLTNNLVSRHIKNVVGAYNQWSENREREKELAELLADIPGRDEKVVKRNKIVFEQVLKNQQLSFDCESAAIYTQKKSKERRAQRKHTLTIARKTLTNLQDTFDLVGVQPMSGPVTLVYTLQYKLDDEGKPQTLEVISHATEAVTRKLRAAWTMEAAQDLKTQHDIDIESEITSALGAEVAYDVSEEIVGDLIKLAQKNTTFDVQAEIADYGNLLAVNLNRAANDIARKTRRGSGNYILTSPMGIAQLETTLKDGLKFQPIKNPSYSSCGVQYMGDIVASGHSLFRVYCSVLSFNKIDTDADVHYLVGYKGTNGECDAGYFFTPYIALMCMGIMVDPVTFQPIQRFATRYGKYVTDNGHDYFRLVKGTLKL